VALARALVVEPKVLLMDEPLSNLDAKVRQRLRAELRGLQKQVGITAIYVTHDQEEALALADTVVLMDQGRIVQTGTPQDIYLKPDTAFAAEFLGVSNQLEGEAGGGKLTIAGRPSRMTGRCGEGDRHRAGSDIHSTIRRPPRGLGTWSWRARWRRACFLEPIIGTTSASARWSSWRTAPSRGPRGASVW